MDDLLRLDGRVAVITGGSSGIGKAAAIEMAKAGAKIALFARGDDRMEEACREIAALGTECECFNVDVSKSAEVKEAMDSVAQRFGRIDIVFANAGINGVWAPIEEITEEEYDRTMDINLKGTFLTVQHAVPHLQKQGKGAVLVTSSVNGTRMFSNTGATVYSTTKAGQVAMAKMLAVELGRQGIRVNAICPGAIETNISENTEQRHTDEIKQPVEYPEGEIPLTGKSPGCADQVGRLALFLASDMADHINGEVVYVDGGQSLVQG